MEKDIVNNEGVCAKRITEAEMRTTFTMTPEQLDSAVNVRSEQFNYETSLDILEYIADNVPAPTIESGIERIAWVIRCAFIMGFRDAATIFNDAAVEGVQLFFGGEETA